MSFEQISIECPDHRGCTVVVGVQNGREVWRSHHQPDLPVGTRLNIDEPLVRNRLGGLDRSARWQLALPEHLPTIGWTPTEHRRVAYQARRRDLFTTQELLAIQDVIGINAADLEVQANEEGWDRDPLPDPRRRT